LWQLHIVGIALSAHLCGRGTELSYHINVRRPVRALWHEGGGPHMGNWDSIIYE